MSVFGTRHVAVFTNRRCYSFGAPATDLSVFGSSVMFNAPRRKSYGLVGYLSRKYFFADSAVLWIDPLPLITYALAYCAARFSL